MTSEEYNKLVRQCNMAVLQSQTSFDYQGKEYSVEFRYVLALLAKEHGYSYRFDNKFLTLKPSQS